MTVSDFGVPLSWNHLSLTLLQFDVLGGEE